MILHPRVKWSVFLKCMPITLVCVLGACFASALLEKSSQRTQKQEILPHPKLESYLIMPIQRIPRYNLLLEDLVMHTWPEHPDYDAVRWTLLVPFPCEMLPLVQCV